MSIIVLTKIEAHESVCAVCVCASRCTSRRGLVCFPVCGDPGGDTADASILVSLHVFWQRAVLWTPLPSQLGRLRAGTEPCLCGCQVFQFVNKKLPRN